MLDRFERPLKIICLAMAALLIWDVSQSFLQGDPLAHLTIPALPVLPGSTNATTNAAPAHTNAMMGAKNGTNANAGTNLASGTNITKGTNLVTGTNTAKATNLVSGTNKTSSTNLVTGTNAITGTNIASSTNTLSGTNLASNTNAVKGTNGATTTATAKARRGGPRGDLPPGLPPDIMAQMMMGGMPGGPMGGMKKQELPHDIQTHVDRIVNSEVFGPVPHPMPMQLLGIAENEAFLRATNGQEGPIKVGAEMGGIKLLRIGMNRVLVETGGEKRELMIFGGAGGESLMPKPSDTPPTAPASTNTTSTNAPAKKAFADAATNAASTNQPVSAK